MKRWLKLPKAILAMVYLLSVLITATIASAADTATLKWEKVLDTSECTIEGYNVYWGKVEGTYPGNKDVGNVSELPNLKSVLGLKGETRYYFVVTAYSIDNEGAVSNVADYVTKAGYKTPPDVIPIEAEVPAKVVITIEIIKEAAIEEVE